MTTPNTLIFVDLASDDPAAAGKFYNEVFGWRDDERPRGVFHRMVPGGVIEEQAQDGYKTRCEEDQESKRKGHQQA